jgi:hypothetical protein
MAAPVAPNPNDNNPIGPAYACNTGLPGMQESSRQRSISAPFRALGMRSSSNSNPKYQPSQFNAVACESTVCKVWSDAVTDLPRTTVAYIGIFKSFATTFEAEKSRAFN